LSELVAGTFYVDENTQRLYVRLPSGLSLSQVTIEAGMRTTPLRINGGRSVTLRNFAIMRSLGAVGDSAVVITNSRNMTVDRMAIQWMAYGGYSGAYNTTVRISGSVFSDNGVVGIGEFRS